MGVLSDDFKNWQVLIVDDEQDNREIASKILTFSGATTRTARNGEEGLEALKEFKPTLILLDLSMPKMNGWDMFKQVRANPEIAFIPIIAITAHALQSEKEQVKDMGFDGYISKPFSIASFLEEIRRTVQLTVRK
jgi:CheY-like chemotaxis protein